MDSFYAGLPGTPFILKGRFPSYSDMVEKFNSQEEYKEVFYGEYAIIDTANKRHKDNGAVYRRGYNGPEYIGKISGPNGLSVKNLRIVTHGNEDFDILYDGDSYTIADKIIYDENGTTPVTYEGDISLLEVSFENDDDGNLIAKTVKEESDKTIEKELARVSVVENMGVPKSAKKEELEENEHNDFQYIVYDIEDKIFGEETKIIIENDGTKEEVSTGTIVETSEIKTCFLGFYDVITYTDVDEYGSITYHYTSREDFTQEKQINWIDQITFDNNGKFFIEMNNDNFQNDEILGPLGWKESDNPTNYKSDFTKVLTWINGASLTDDGIITLNFNNNKLWSSGNKDNGQTIIGDNDAIQKVLTWIDNASFTEKTGELKITFNNDELWNEKNESLGQYVEDKKDFIKTIIEYVSALSLSDDGTLSATYNTGKIDIVKNNIKWIKSVVLDDKSGKVTVTYNTKTDGTNNDSETLGPITWITDVKINDDGKLVITTNNGSQNYTSSATLNSIQEVYCYAPNDDTAADLWVRYLYPPTNTTSKTTINEVEGYWVNVGEVPATNAVTENKIKTEVEKDIQPAIKENMGGTTSLISSEENTAFSYWNVDINNTVTAA